MMILFVDLDFTNNLHLKSNLTKLMNFLKILKHIYFEMIACGSSRDINNNNHFLVF
jgi:hypothetical protein